MSFSANRARRAKRGELSIDLTPLIDVVFQLLIFFVLTSTFQNNPAFKVKLPKAKNRDTTTEPKAVVVTIGKGGEMNVDGKVVDARELGLRLCAAAQVDATTAVNIKADQSTEHQFVVEVMDAAKGCGLERLGILHR
ncbi:MAG: biopolymer transporter ExbD [Deltaproteobacteria bacterium]|nr:biopolymer transporter ExbD [Nannocystaceae bacterium]